MTVQLAPRKDNDNQVNILSNANEKQVEGMYRLKENLDKGFAEEYLKQSALSRGLGYVDLFGIPIDTSDLIKISKEDALFYNMGVFRRKKDTLMIATTEYNPEKQAPLIDKLNQKGYNLAFYLCSSDSWNKLIKTYDFVIQAMEYTDQIHLNQSKLDALFQTRLDGAALHKILERAELMTISDILEQILVAAVQNQASDIHFEPEKDHCSIRLRLDGVLYEFGTVNREVQMKLESRIKLMTNLKLNVYDIPQDGRFSFIAQGKPIDVRTSLLPSNYGYSIVMRLLGLDTVALEFESLGFMGSGRIRLLQEIKKPQGMILTTGPTGSGKTTTLYTILKSLNTGESKIITLEDPIEYKLEGITQTQVHKPDTAYDTRGNIIVQEGYTFAGGLRSIMRQDPDVVMVGEIRDSETAEVAIDAALTGHKVLSTLHTNDAVGSIPRLMELGVKGYALADGVSAIIAQRLVRKLCQNCKKESTLTQEQKDMVDNIIKAMPKNHGYDIPHKMKFFHSAGCNICNGLGYKGRVGVYEVFLITDGVRTLLNSAYPSVVELRTTSVKEGMVPMIADAVMKAIQGITDIDEIQRIITY